MKVNLKFKGLNARQFALTSYTMHITTKNYAYPKRACSKYSN